MKRGRQGKNYKLQNIFIDDCDKVSLWRGCYRRTVVISPGKRPASDMERWETAVFLGQTDNCCIEGLFFFWQIHLHSWRRGKSFWLLLEWFSLSFLWFLLFSLWVYIKVLLSNISLSTTFWHYTLKVLYQLPEENYGVPVQKKWYPHLEACNTCETLLVQMLWDQIPFSHS